MNSELTRGDDTRSEIAAVAARLIAEDGADWGAARLQAAHIVLGPGAERRGQLPSNDEIETALRSHLRTFAADTHPQLLAGLRWLAAAVMERLASFDLQLVGGVLNGTATEHSDLHFHVFADSAKELEVALMDAGIDFDAHPPESGEGPEAEEVIAFVLPVPREAGLPPRMRSIGVAISVFDERAARIAPRYRSKEPGLHPVEASGRADRAALRRLIEESQL